MHSIHLPDITTTAEEGHTAAFVIEPLHRGFGITLGNSLRRVLLSSLNGAAVTAFSIEGASHEFTSLPGVKEDVVQITLNLKKLRFRTFSDQPQTVQLKKRSKGPVTAADIQTTADLEVVNPEQLLATLAEAKTELIMNIRVEAGRGYVSAEEHHAQLPVGMIAIDSLFSPIRRVRYHVDNTRVGQVTDLDKLTLEIETDGSLEPRQALEAAASTLADQFTVISGSNAMVDSESPEAESSEALNISLDDLGLTPRTANALEKNEINTVAQLAALSETELKSLKGFGAKAMDEVMAKLRELELK